MHSLWCKDNHVQVYEACCSSYRYFKVAVMRTPVTSVADLQYCKHPFQERKVDSAESDAKIIRSASVRSIFELQERLVDHCLCFKSSKAALLVPLHLQYNQ